MTDQNYQNLEDWEQLPFLSKVLGTAPSIIYIFNHKTRSNEYVNRSMGQSLGYSAQEVQAMGDALLPTIIHPDDLPMVGPHFELLNTLPDGEVAQLEYRLKHKDGRWLWWLAYDTVFQRDEAGELIRHLGVATDITVQKKAEQLAQDEKRIADAASEELRSFAYSMSHDMKAPSNTLSLLLAELKENHGANMDQDANELMDLSLRTVDRMQSLVEDVLTYTRVIVQNVKAESVDLKTVIDDLLVDLKTQIENADAKVIVEKLPSVMGSVVQIRILLLNLIGNALKYRKTDVKPVVIIRSSKQGDDMVHIHVIDNGIGIAPRYHHKIFEIFQRLHGTDEYPGTGLGLAICKRIVLNLGGNLTIDSEAGEGAAFTFSVKTPPEMITER
ncbi:ATP-binding protein [Granulosicoccus sp.]|nr:ATP-binding protein [Granulosicoccus sp.]